MAPRRLSVALSLAAVVTAALFAALAAQPAAATPDREVDCVGCHGGTYRGTTTATPSAIYPAAGTSYTVAIGTPDAPGAVFNTGYWVANSTVAGATGPSTGVFGGGMSTQHAYTASLKAPAVEGLYYYKVFAVEGTKSSSDYTNFALFSIVVDATAPLTTDNTDGKAYRSFKLVLTPSDGAAGVAGTQYRIDGGPWRFSTTATLSATGKRRRALGAGTHLVEYFSTDNAGNVESIKSCQVILTY